MAMAWYWTVVLWDFTYLCAPILYEIHVLGDRNRFKRQFLIDTQGYLHTR